MAIQFNLSDLDGVMDNTQFEELERGSNVDASGELLKRTLTAVLRLERTVASMKVELCQLRKEVLSHRTNSAGSNEDVGESQSLLDGMPTPISRTSKRKSYATCTDENGQEIPIMLTNSELLDIQSTAKLQSVIRKALLHFHEASFLRQVTLTGDQRSTRTSNDSNSQSKRLPLVTLNGVFAIVGTRFKKTDGARLYDEKDIRAKITRVLANFHYDGSKSLSPKYPSCSVNSQDSSSVNSQGSRSSDSDPMSTLNSQSPSSCTLASQSSSSTSENLSLLVVDSDSQFLNDSQIQ